LICTALFVFITDTLYPGAVPQKAGLLCHQFFSEAKNRLINRTGTMGINSTAAGMRLLNSFVKINRKRPKTTVPAVKKGLICLTLFFTLYG
jgi:hypothetical protein